MEWDELSKVSIKLIRLSIVIGIALWGRYRISKRNKALQRFHYAFDSDDFEGSLWHLNKYIEAHPKDDIAFYYKGAALLGLDEPDLAEAAFRHALELNKKCEYAHFGLGQIYSDKNLDDQALKHFKQAKPKMKKYALLYYHMGLCEMVLGNTNQALRSLKRALAYEKSDKDYIRYGLYCFYKEQEDLDNAMKYRSEIVDKEKYFNH